jgi:hypothetical protein
MNPLEYLLWNRLTGFPFPPRNVYCPEGRHAVPSQRNGFYVACWARPNQHPALHPEGRMDGWMDDKLHHKWNWTKTKVEPKPNLTHLFHISLGDVGLGGACGTRLSGYDICL